MARRTAGTTTLVALVLLGVAIWFLFLLTLPKICLLGTELTVATYYFPFMGPYLNAVAVVLLFAASVPSMLLPGGVVLALLYFFPRVICSLLGLFVLWQLWPLVGMLKEYFGKLIEAPYGVLEGDPPQKIRGGEEAVEAALNGKTHYEVLNSHRAASNAELKACYRRMALLLHPDKNPEESAAVAFKKVSDAWDALSTPLNRAEYDAGLDGSLGEGDEEAKAEAEKEDVREFARSGDTGVPSGPPGLKKRQIWNAHGASSSWQCGAKSIGRGWTKSCFSCRASGSILPTRSSRAA